MSQAKAERGEGRDLGLRRLCCVSRSALNERPFFATLQGVTAETPFQQLDRLDVVLEDCMDQPGSFDHFLLHFGESKEGQDKA